MKSTPKLQDTLEIFLTEIEELKKDLEKIKIVNQTLSQHIEEIKKVSIKPDLGEMKTLNTEIAEGFSQENKRLENLFQNNFQKLEEFQNGNREGFVKYSYYLIFAFMISLCSVFIAVKAHFSRSAIQKELNRVQSYNSALESYIKESKQADNYYKWLDSKSKNNRKN